MENKLNEEENVTKNLKNNQDINELKILLANEATTMLHGSKAAKDSELTAKKIFQDKSVGKSLPVIKIKKNEDIYKLTTKDEIIAILGPPNYIDPIEKKYIYYSEKKISKNFYNNKTVERILIVFHFNSENTIK